VKKILQNLDILWLSWHFSLNTKLAELIGQYLIVVVLPLLLLE